ncbi:MAG TPA: hypothetical protein VKB69_14625 [Micromonosporaceae bacterium]|nr:hypothetical protein [Micromonosporaceae bacterium]
MPALFRRIPRIPGSTLISRRIALGVLCTATAGAATLGIALNDSNDKPSTNGTVAASLTTDRNAAIERANRSMVRPPAPKPAAPKPAAKPAPKKPGPLPHIAGLSASQVANAWAVVQEGHREGISKRGQIIAMATALQESKLINYRSAVDHDSLGIFQQRPSMGWGSRAQITNPTYAARAFYRVLVQYKGSWGCLTCAAQRVQRSAYPSAYAKHERFATEIVNILNRRF